MNHLGPAFQRELGTTQWSVVLAASELSEPASRQALARLFEIYWFPLYAFARRDGATVDDARDAVQGFFAVLLEKNGLRTVNPDLGRFRSFLIGAFRHYLANERQRAAALKRGGGVPDLALDLAESRYCHEPADDATPERVFERRWGQTVVDRALGRLKQECEAAGNAERYEALKGFLAGDRARGAMTAAAQRLGLSPGAVRVAVHRLRGRFGELLRDEVAATVASAQDVDAELRHLLRVLRA